MRTWSSSNNLADFVMFDPAVYSHVFVPEHTTEGAAVRGKTAAQPRLVSMGTQ